MSTQPLISGAPASLWTPLRGAQGGLPDVAAETASLIRELIAHPWGQIAPSVYETARLVALAPWLAGASARLDFLLAHQHEDGTWNTARGYRLVQTLSATDALLATLRRDDAPGGGYARIVAAARRALRALADLLRTPMSIPDTPAVGIIVPSLIASINAQLDQLACHPDRDPWGASGRLPLPAGMTDRALTWFRARLAAGQPVPPKMLHALEAGGDAARAAPGVAVVPPGTVGASPAATAAWLGEQEPPAGHPARRHLEALVRDSGGPVPCCIPVNVFERAWVLRGLSLAGLDAPGVTEIIASVDAALGDAGAASGPGLPPDADTTAVALYGLARWGRPKDVRCLASFDMSTHFCTWPGEEGVSTSVNAHVLEALGERTRGDPHPPHRGTLRRLSAWLRARQLPDGRWQDRWHLSDYYATLACTAALSRFARDDSEPQLRRALTWVLTTQRDDGSWGMWEGTIEETAYAIQILLMAAGPDDRDVDSTAARGCRYLVDSIGLRNYRALWIGKDAYLPVAVIRCAVLEAIHLALRRPTLVQALATS